jgi:hypothetical protein
MAVKKATTTKLVATPNPAVVGQVVLFTATVSESDAGPPEVWSRSAMGRP